MVAALFEIDLPGFKEAALFGHVTIQSIATRTAAGLTAILTAAILLAALATALRVAHRPSRNVKEEQEAARRR